MSRVDNAINEIVHIDELANDNQWINKIHPLVKFVITILFICMVISFDKYNMTGLVSMSVYPIVLFVICDFSFKGALYRL
ncbi:MAG: cobalt ECF transporter T component CbiQ, partial [Agathobacter sp.]|nr:cobalt ECF transporter T component CbiQ [Agathobacter sp.]